MEQIKSFFEKVKTDESLQATLKELAERKAGVEEIVALAKEKGFGFTKEDFEAFVQKSMPAGDLSEEQLAAVSGGGINPLLWLSSIAVFTCIGLGAASIIEHVTKSNCDL